jgi:hypothetical protein
MRAVSERCEYGSQRLDDATDVPAEIQAAIERG